MNIQMFFSSYFSNKNQNIEEILPRFIQETKSEFVYKIYTETFINYYTQKLNQFFQNITQQKVLYCKKCLNNASINLKECISLHNINNIAFSFDSLFQYFEEIIKTELFISQKFKIYLKKELNDFSLSQEIAFHFLSHITKLIKLRLFILLEKFKSEKNINDPNIVISINIKLILKNLKLFEIYQDSLSKFIKEEIKNNLEPYLTIHNKQIIHEMIKIFENYYLEWSYLNDTLNVEKISNTSKQNYKETFIKIIKKNFIKMKLEKFFEIISNYPESTETIYDIKLCISNYNQSEFVSTIENQISSRLLTPGISTRLIIEIFIRIIKIMKTIESSGYLLNLISAPIKEYLRLRKDTMQWIITTILSEDDNNIIEDMSKAYVRNIKTQDYDYLSSDDEPESWEPINIKGIKGIFIENNNDFKKNKTDIISTLVNIFGSPEKFMEQYRRMLSERKINDNNFILENEIKNLELLKLKFGENLLNNCDVIIKDIKDSKKLNQNILKDELINCLIINKNYWPFLNNNIFDINDISSVYKEDIPETKYDIFLKQVKEHINNYKKNFSKKNFSRELTLYSNVGYANITLTFKNGDFNFIVTPLSAFIIQIFDKENENYFKLYNLEFISKKLKADLDDVKKSINFWVTKGVLKEIINNGNINYEPNDYFQNVEQSEIIIEENINNFEYPVEVSNSNLIENSLVSIIKSSGPKNFEQLYKNLISYQLEISEIKLKDLLGKMTLEQKIFKEGENYKLIVSN